MLRPCTFLLFLKACAAEWALVNLIRHGERSQNKSNEHLTPDGYARSQYIARCVGTDIPTLAFPLGPPQVLIASNRPHKSVRPFETLKPLADTLGLPVDNSIFMSDIPAFEKYVQSLPAGGTLLVAWEHWFIPFLARSMDPGGLSRQRWPETCKFHEWTEPEYTEGACYDMLWQLILFRPNASVPWFTQAYSQMHMGFGGRADAPCESALYPHSNPTGWHQVRPETLAAAGPAAGAAPAPPSAATACLPGLGLLARAAGLAALAARLWAAAEGARGLGGGEPLLGGAAPAPRAGGKAAAARAALLASAGLACAALGVGAQLGLALPAAAPTLLRPALAPTALAAKETVATDLESFMYHFLMGGLAGIIAKTIACPIERVKLLIQTQDTIPKIMSGEMPRYKGICDCFFRVYREQGLMSFWRGNLPNVLRYFPVAAFNFSFKDAIQSCFPKYDPKTQFLNSLLVNLASGGIAGACSLTIVYPLDYCRTRLAADIGGGKGARPRSRSFEEISGKRQFTGLCDVLCQTIKCNGFTALYSGYFVSVVGIIVYRAPYFGLYDTFSEMNPIRPAAGDDWAQYLLGVATNFIVAQVTSAIAAFLSYPFDTVRRRLQMEATLQKKMRKYHNMVHCAYKIVKEEGCAALFKGFIANLFRGACTAFMLVLFHELTTNRSHGAK